ncbi:hypothetical protein TNCV_167451 [Trichonephila clavipes]|nr:hypothetical protein TNCV_167451 [Trichonephila clavipes]
MAPGIEKTLVKRLRELELDLNRQYVTKGVRLCITVPSEEFIAVDNDNVCVTPIMAEKDILEFVQSSKNIIDAESNDENEMINAAPHSSHIIRNEERHEKYAQLFRHTFQW